MDSGDAWHALRPDAGRNFDSRYGGAGAFLGSAVDQSGESDVLQWRQIPDVEGQHAAGDADAQRTRGSNCGVLAFSSAGRTRLERDGCFTRWQKGVRPRWRRGRHFGWCVWAWWSAGSTFRG